MRLWFDEHEDEQLLQIMCKKHVRTSYYKLQPMAAASEINVGAAIAAALLELDGIITLKE